MHDFSFVFFFSLFVYFEGKSFPYILSDSCSLLFFYRKKRISTKDLALFINAMTVACVNPRNFFHVNVVAELRKRVDNSNHTNPFFILTLCNAGEIITTDYVQKLQQLLNDHSQPSFTGKNKSQIEKMVSVRCFIF